MSAGYDFWLVDLDGTLVDVHPEYVHDVVERVGERLDTKFTTEEADQLWRGLRGEPERLLRAKGVDPVAFWDAYHQVEDPIERADATFLYDDASVIAELDGPIGVVTHCQPYLTEPVLDGLDIGDWFDAVVCCNDELGWKPDPGPVHHAVEVLDRRLDGDGGILVGDTQADVGAAWNAGLDAVHVERYGADRRGCCVRADHRLTALDELASVLATEPGAQHTVDETPADIRGASD